MLKILTDRLGTENSLKTVMNERYVSCYTLSIIFINKYGNKKCFRIFSPNKNIHVFQQRYQQDIGWKITKLFLVLPVAVYPFSTHGATRRVI